MPTTTTHLRQGQNPNDNDLVRIAPLESKQQCRGVFKNEKDEPNFRHLINWFNTLSWQAQTERQSKTYLIFYDNTVIGYFALSITKVKLTQIKYTTKYDDFLLLLGKMYVSEEFRGQGVGTIALQVVIDIASQFHQLVGCRGVIVDANNDSRTVKFYKKFGFEVLDEDTKSKTTRMLFRLP